ncbi:MAG TPA: aspartate kinase [Gaiellaceae bacterium]|nr:aspartate kinase [Gaiellaceae bacterium]
MTTTHYEAVPQVAADAASERPGLVVMKFGGSSVADTEKITEVARRLVRAREAGHRVVGVLSAMGDTTDELIRLAHEISPRPHPREYDMLISVGERISNSLCAMAVHDLGHEAISFTGSQAGIVTDAVHGKAKIAEVRATRINDALDAEKIVLVAGFQGVSADSHDVTTLGRGGSDTTAVALAAALGAHACEIYTDVEGVFTADPRLVSRARKLPAVTYEEMLELAAGGARVLQLRSVEFARNHDVRLHVRSTFSDTEGTWIVDEEDPVLEKAIISGVAHTGCEPLYRVREIDAASLFDRLAGANVNVDTILQVASDEIVFSAPLEDRATCEELLGGLDVEWSMRDDLGKVSLVGAGMRSHPGIAAKTFATLEETGVEAKVISTSPIKIACHVRTEDVPKAVAALHDAFELEIA